MGSQIITKPLLLLGGLALIKNCMIFFGVATYLIFAFTSIRSLKFNGLILVLPFFVYFNINQFLLLSHFIPIAIPLLMTVKLLHSNFVIDNSQKIGLFFYGFYWYFFSFLLNPILLVAIPAAAFVVFSELHSISAKIRIKKLLSISLLPNFGLACSIIVKYLLLFSIGSSEIDNYKSSPYWKDSVSFASGVKNIQSFNNYSIFWISIIAIICVCSVKMNNINIYFYLSLSLLGLVYPLLIPEHTLHTFSAASSYPLTISYFLILRFFANFFIGDKPLILRKSIGIKRDLT
jgi:hypothetical protein